MSVRVRVRVGVRPVVALVVIDPLRRREGAGVAADVDRLLRLVDAHLVRVRARVKS